jgi:hypothetical protein
MDKQFYSNPELSPNEIAMLGRLNRLNNWYPLYKLIGHFKKLEQLKFVEIDRAEQPVRVRITFAGRMAWGAVQGKD